MKSVIKQRWENAKKFVELFARHPTAWSFKALHGEEFALIVSYDFDFTRFVLQLNDSKKMVLRTSNFFFRLDAASTANAIAKSEIEYEVWDTHWVSNQKPGRRDEKEAPERKEVAHRHIGYLRFTPTEESCLVVARAERRAEGEKRLADLKTALMVAMPNLESVSVERQDDAIELRLCGLTDIMIRVGVTCSGEAVFALETIGIRFELLEIWSLLNA